MAIITNADRFLAMVDNLERSMVLNGYSSIPFRDRLSDSLSADDAMEYVDAACKYPIELTTKNYLDLYEREGLAARVVNVFPQESWSLDPLVYEIEDEKETTFEKAFIDLEKKINLFYYLELVDILSGIGRFGVLFLGFNDGADPKTAVAKIDSDGKLIKVKRKSMQLMYVRPLHEGCVKIKKIDHNIRSPRYGLPEVYEITFQDANDQSGEVLRGTYEVHWSRILHVADNRGTSQIYGSPRIRLVFNRIFDMKKTVGGSAEMFWKGAFPGISFEAIPEVASGDVEFDAEAHKEEIRKWNQGLQRYITLIGMTAKSLAPQIADPESHVRVEVGMIAASLPVPLRVFLGSEEAKLASSQDIRTHHSRINRRRMRYLTPFLLNPLVERLIAVGSLPKPKEVKVAWPDLNELGQNDQATTAVKITDALSKYVASDVEQIFPLKEYLIKVHKFTLEEADAVVAAAEEQKKKNSRITLDDAQMAEKTAKATASIQERQLKMQAKLKPAVPGGIGKKKGSGSPSNRAKITSKSVRTPGPKTEQSV